VVITVEDSPAASATSIADLQGLLIGAQTGTTSLDAVEQVIAPTAGAQVFNTNDDAKLALQNGQVDAIVVDLPPPRSTSPRSSSTAARSSASSRRPSAGGDQFGLVLAKDSPLTERVTAAVDALREDGTLDEARRRVAGRRRRVLPVLE
jgi:polar amino acid transport system substrate-binding protein